MLLSACGGDNDDESGSENDTTSTASLPPDIDVNEDQATVEDAVLKLSDLPSGWREETSEGEDDDDNPFDVDECGEIKALGEAAQAAQTAEGDSSTFVRSEAVINNSILAVSSEDVASSLFAALDNTAEANECFSALIRQGADEEPLEDAELRDVSVGRTSIGDFGDDSISYQIEAEVEAQGLSPSAYNDIAFVRVGRYMALFDFFDVLSPIDPAEEADVIGAVVGRLEGAGSGE